MPVKGFESRLQTLSHNRKKGFQRGTGFVIDLQEAQALGNVEGFHKASPWTVLFCRRRCLTPSYMN
jgi:hypothetical protein